MIENYILVLTIELALKMSMV